MQTNQQKNNIVTFSLLQETRKTGKHDQKMQKKPKNAISKLKFKQGQIFKASRLQSVKTAMHRN